MLNTLPIPFVKRYAIQLLIIVAVASIALWVYGKRDRVIDASSEAAFTASLDQIHQSLPAEQRLPFEMSLRELWLATGREFMHAAWGSEAEGMGVINRAFRARIAGKTGWEIIRMGKSGQVQSR